MSSSRGSLWLLAGAIVGFVAGIAAASLAGSAGADPDGRPHERASQLERELALERAARATDRAAREQAEDARRAAEQELERARASAARPAVASKDLAPGAATPPPTPSAPSRDGSKETREGSSGGADRLRALEREVERALEAKDPKAMIALLEELAKLGKDAWPLVAKLAVAAQQAAVARPDLGPNLFRALTAFPELYADAIADATRWPVEFRQLAVGYYPWTGHDPKDTLFVSRLASETDDGVGTSMANMVCFLHDATIAPGLVTALEKQPRTTIRLRILAALAEQPGEDARRGLEQASRVDPDPEVRRAAEYALRSREPSAVGFFITYLAADSKVAAAGLREGDIVTTAKGISLLSVQDVFRVLQAVGAAPKDECALVVLRAGATFSLAVTGADVVYQLFGSGRCVRPDAK